MKSSAVETHRMRLPDAVNALMQRAIRWYHPEEVEARHAASAAAVADARATVRLANRLSVRDESIRDSAVKVSKRLGGR